MRVRFAEINRTALKDWSTRFSTLNPHKLSDNGNWTGSTDPTVPRPVTIAFLLESANANLRPSSRPTQKGDLRTWPSRI